MNHFHLSIKINMGDVLYSLIIVAVVGLVYFTSVDGHVLRCKYFFYIFFLICTQKANNVIYNELFSDDQALKKVAIVHVHQRMYCGIILNYSLESMVVASQKFLGWSAFSHQRLCYTKLTNRLHLSQRRHKYSF